MKKINVSHQWRYPTIIDRHPEFIEYLKTNPPYEDALYVRKHMLRHLELEVGWSRERGEKPKRKSLRLFEQPKKTHLKLID